MSIQCYIQDYKVLLFSCMPKLSYIIQDRCMTVTSWTITLSYLNSIYLYHQSKIQILFNVTLYYHFCMKQRNLGDWILTNWQLYKFENVYIYLQFSPLYWFSIYSSQISSFLTVYLSLYCVISSMCHIKLKDISSYYWLQVLFTALLIMTIFKLNNTCL